jgi:hypothetical protein
MTHVDTDPIVEEALALFDQPGFPGREWAAKMALQEGILAMVDRFEQKGRLEAPFRFELQQGRRRVNEWTDGGNVIDLATAISEPEGTS